MAFKLGAKGGKAQSGSWGVQSVQKPWLKQDQKQQRPVASADVTGDDTWPKDARYAGEVISYYKFSGYGFIKPDLAGIVPGDKVFVFWKSLQSDDRFPSLTKGMRVEYGISQRTKNGQPMLTATNVTLQGGTAVAVQDMQDAKKTFIGGQNLRYTGTLKFFSPKMGFGYIALDDGFAFDEEVPKEIRVETAEVNAGGRNPSHVKETLVEFGIWKTQKGAFKAYNMTLPGGQPMTSEALEHRQPQTTSRTYKGTVCMWNWRQGWGFIEPEAGTVFPPAIQAKVQQAATEAATSGKTFEHEWAIYFRKTDVAGDFRLEKGATCTFQVYTDDKGVGANNVQA